MSRKKRQQKKQEGGILESLPETKPPEISNAPEASRVPKADIVSFWRNLWAKGFSLYVLFALFFGIYLILWFQFTDAHFNEEALLFFMRPVELSVLILSRYGFSEMSLCFEEFDRWYGFGFFFFPALIYGLGLSAVFLENLWLLCVLLAQMVALLPFLLFDDRKKQFFFFLLLFSFPLVQISIKSGSLHSWIVFLMLIAVFLRENRRDYSRASVAGFVVFASLACIFKHLGFVLLLIYFLASALHVRASGESLRRLSGPFLLVLLIAAPFYLSSRPLLYSDLFFGHRSGFGFIDAVFLCLALSLFVYYCRAQIKSIFRRSGGVFAANPWWLVFWLLLFAGFDLLMFSGGLVSIKFRFYLFISAYFGLIYHLWAKVPGERATLYFLFFLSYGFSLFLYIFAHHIDFFVFPMVIWLYLFCCEYQKKKAIYVFIGLGLLFSNFFPTQYWFASADLPALHAFYGRVCASATWSPLNWSEMPINGLKRKMDQIISNYVRFNRKQDLYGLSVDLNTQTVQELNPVKHSDLWSPYFNMNRLPITESELPKEFLLQGKEKIFREWSSKGTVSILMKGMRPDLEFTETAVPLEEWFVDNEYKNFSRMTPGMKATLISAIGFSYFAWLQETELLYKHYVAFDIPAKKPYMTVFLHESLLSDKGEWYADAHSRFLDGFVEVLRRKRKAGQHFLQAEPYFDAEEPDWMQAYLHLLPAYALDPDSAEIERDYQIARERLKERYPYLFSQPGTAETTGEK
jgi:hypothetical protein